MPEIGKNEITVYGQKNLSAVNVRTHEYPGLPTDLQAVFAVFLTQAVGESALFETIYENRLGYIPELVSMVSAEHTGLEFGHEAEQIAKGVTAIVHAAESALAKAQGQLAEARQLLLDADICPECGHHELFLASDEECSSCGARNAACAAGKGTGS